MDIGKIGTNHIAPQAPAQAPVKAAESKEAEVKDSVNLGSSEIKPYSQDVRQLIDKLAKTSGCEVEKMVIVSGTDGDDEITVKRGPEWTYDITVNGETKNYSQSDVRNMIIDGGKGNDRIIVDKDLSGDFRITGGEGNDYIRGGKGADVIIDNYGQNFIAGGEGSDIIVANGFDIPANAGNNPYSNGIIATPITGNIISGGRGNDYLEGSAAGDLIMTGSGNDTVYAKSGNDIVSAGAGRKYIDAGRGDDYVRGGKDHNMIFGGDGNDVIDAGAGKNVILSGRGQDTVNAENSTGKIIYTDGDKVTPGQTQTTQYEPIDVPGNIVVGDHAKPEQTAGSAEHEANLQASFQERVENDLEFMAASETGTSMLSHLKEAGHQVNITETNGGNNCKNDGEGGAMYNGIKGKGCDSTIGYNVSRIQAGSLTDWAERPPVVGVYHEMAHSYNAATGTMDMMLRDDNGYEAGRWGTPGCEFQAVGIPAHRLEPNPEGVTENSMRELLELPERKRY